MAKMKVHELAKELEIQSKEVLAFLQEKGFEVKAAQSSVEDEQIALVKGHFEKKEAPKAEPKQEETKAAPKAKEAEPAKTENAEKTFPKGVTIAAIVIAVGYAVGIFACGLFTNWNEVLSSETVHMGNVVYVLMNNLGYQLGLGFGMSQSSALTLGAWVARFVGLSMFLALAGAFFTLTYSPLKTLIQGSPKEIWPGKFGELKDGMPVNAMIVQAVIVIVMILAVSFGGEDAAAFFSILVLMTNVAMTIPYMFLSAAFPAFKKKQLDGKIEKPFMVYKSYSVALIASIIVTVFVGFANVFTIIEPALSGNMLNTIMMIAGPVVFAIIAFILYTVYERKYIKSRD